MKKDLMNRVEKTIDESVGRLLTHPTFLQSASLVVNFNSFRRKWLRQAIDQALAKIELPRREDQERMYSQIETLKARLEDLESTSRTKLEVVQGSRRVGS
ncbi:MAG: hypothetical protein V4760_06395 [Bdellovibrionota bacterium]